MSVFYYFSIEPPAQYRAGFVGAERTPFYFDCADCASKAPAIAGFLGTGPTFADIGCLPAGPGETVFRKLALFCAPCYAARIAASTKA